MIFSHDEAKKNYQVNPTVKAMIDDIQAKYKADSSKVVIENSPLNLAVTVWMFVFEKPTLVMWSQMLSWITDNQLSHTSLTLP